MLKICGKCKIEKPVSQFYISRKQSGGYQYACKPCSQENAKEWHEKVGFFKTESGRNALAKASMKSKRKYPEKEKARIRLRAAVKRGEVVKPDKCEKCSETKIHGHHYAGYDGENWSKVIWLCAKHHAEVHKVRKSL